MCRARCYKLSVFTLIFVVFQRTKVVLFLFSHEFADFARGCSLNELRARACLLRRDAIIQPAESQRHIEFQNSDHGVAGFQFDDVTDLIRLQFICKSNSNEISQSTADVMYFLFCKETGISY